MIPFWLCGGGGCHTSSIDVESNGMAETLMGEPLGAVK